MNYATGMSSIPASQPINQNMMKFKQIQNSMPLNSNMIRQIIKVKSTKAAGSRTTRTVMIAGPTVSGDSPD